MSRYKWEHSGGREGYSTAIEHFQTTLNVDTPSEEEDQNNQTNDTSHTESETDDSAPEVKEIWDIIRKMKNGRAGGEDDIVIELIKLCNTELLIKEIQQLIASVWTSKSMPEEWQSCILFPIHKKGDKRDCKNYRGISLLNVIYKIFSNALYKRMEPVAEKILGDYQCGFRRNRSTTDQYFALSQIFEKFHEYSREVHCLFVDFRQAFDSIIRQKIAPTLINLGIPQISQTSGYDFEKNIDESFGSGKTDRIF